MMSRDSADGMTDMPQPEGDEPNQITLDKNYPDNAEALANVKEGDMLKVVKDDENETVLEKVPDEGAMSEDEPADTGGGQESGAGEEGEEKGNFGSDKPAIAILLAKKRKQ